MPIRCLSGVTFNIGVEILTSCLLSILNRWVLSWMLFSAILNGTGDRVGSIPTLSQNTFQIGEGCNRKGRKGTPERGRGHSYQCIIIVGGPKGIIPFSSDEVMLCAVMKFF